MCAQASGDLRRLAHEAQAAALAVGDVEPARDGVIDLLAGCHPCPGDKTLAREHLALGGGEGLGRVTAFVLEQMPQILVARDAEQHAVAAEARGELEIGEISAAAAVEPVLLLGEIVVANSGTMQRAQRRLGGTKIAGIAMRLGDMQRHAVDPAAHQRLASGKQQRRRDAELTRRGERATLAPEQQDRQTAAPPRHLIEPAQHRIDFAVVGAEAATLDGRKHVALEHDAAAPTPAKFRRFVACDHAHPSSTRLHSAACGRAPTIQASRSASARAHKACFLPEFLGPSPPSATGRAARGGS